MTRSHSSLYQWVTLREAFDIVGGDLFGAQWTGHEADFDPDRLRDEPQDIEVQTALQRHAKAVKKLLHPLYSGQTIGWIIPRGDAASKKVIIASLWPDPDKFDPSEPRFKDFSFNVATSWGALEPPEGKAPSWYAKYAKTDIWYPYSPLEGRIEIDLVALNEYISGPEDLRNAATLNTSSEACPVSLTDKDRAKGGSRRKYDFSLQDAIDRICDEIIANERKATLGAVKDWLHANSSYQN